MLLCAVYKRGTDLIGPLYLGSKLVKPFSRLLLSGKYFTEGGQTRGYFYRGSPWHSKCGCGSPPPCMVLPIFADKLDKVFEQFYRVSGGMQHTFPGLGLGLYISAEIIRREGGRIWAASNGEKGSVFSFSLPLERVKD